LLSNRGSISRRPSRLRKHRCMFDPTTLVGFHTWLSLIALASGFVVLAGLIHGQELPLWTTTFLATAVGTSVTGFLFPFNGFLPSHGVGVIALVVLLVALLARYAFRLAAAWRWIYAATIVERLFSRLRRHRAGISEDSRSQRPRTDPIGSAVRRHAARSARSLRRTGPRSREVIPNTRRKAANASRLGPLPLPRVEGRTRNRPASVAATHNDESRRLL
jgi:hypothetical protein